MDVVLREPEFSEQEGDPLTSSDDKLFPFSNEKIGILVSLLLHFCLIAFFTNHTLIGDFSPGETKPMEVTYLDLRELDLGEQKPEKQIISKTEAPEKTPAVPTKLRAEKDASTEVETIKRGEDGGETRESSPQKSQQKNPPPEKAAPDKAVTQKDEQLRIKEEKKSSAKEKQPSQVHSTENTEKHVAKNESITPASAANAILKLDHDQLERTLNKIPHETEPKPPSQSTLDRAINGDLSPKASDSTRKNSFRSQEPFSNTSLGSLFSGRSGSSDYLPHIQDGSLTLLNAKADRFAVFVRRVAMQVFAALRRSNWQSLAYSDVIRVSEFAEVEAVMSPTGDLIRVELRSSSGSSKFDGVLVGAAKSGSTDRNPPLDALADDGNIHFIFAARTWARPSPNGVGEQRWLLLGTGLE